MFSWADEPITSDGAAGDSQETLRYVDDEKGSGWGMQTEINWQSVVKDSDADGDANAG